MLLTRSAGPAINLVNPASPQTDCRTHPQLIRTEPRAACRWGCCCSDRSLTRGRGQSWSLLRLVQVRTPKAEGTNAECDVADDATASGGLGCGGAESPPQPCKRVAKSTQSRTIHGHSVVTEVSQQFRAQVGSLLLDGRVHALPQFVFQRPQLGLPPLPHRVAQHGEVPLPGFATTMRKAQEVESDASYARRRTAARRRLIVAGARCRSSRCIRKRITTVLLKERRGSEQYQATNSSMLRLYSRCEPGDERLLTTAALACSRSGRPSLVFGRTNFSLFLGFMTTGSFTVDHESTRVTQPESSYKVRHSNE